MGQLVSELILTLDGLTKGTKSPGYYGFDGPEFMKWLGEKSAQPHRNLIGRKTYELLNSLPEEARDDDFQIMTKKPGWVFSKTLKKVDWPGLEIVSSDLCEFVQNMKKGGGDEIRTLGSLSIVRQLIEANLVNCFRIISCPLVLPQTGDEPVYDDWPDTQFQLLEHKLLDGRVFIIDYRPDGSPPRS
ncbi:MAG: dihydrofolate reductase family protein [Gammaproteobacteria bacterium]